MTDSDTRPAIIKFVERVSRAVGKPTDAGTLERAPVPRPPRRPEWHTTAPAEHHPPAVESQDRTRIQIAARHALSTYPGPVGDLIHRELQAFLEFGYRFGDGTVLAARLVEHVMATAQPNASPSR